jgi:hypothetical protein
MCGLSPQRVHLVDYNASVGNFLFRSNMPTNDTTFAYNDLMALLDQRVRDGTSLSNLPPNTKLHVISLNNDADGDDFAHEKKFWADPANAIYGTFTNWPLGLAGLVGPTDWPKPDRCAHSKNVWGVDKIPDHVNAIRTIFETKGDSPIAIVVHCTAGCDRTGEVIGSYTLQYLEPNVTKAYAMDQCQPSRYPNYWGTGAMEWYCYLLRCGTSGPFSDTGICDHFADCKTFGACVPTNKTK